MKKVFNIIFLIFTFVLLLSCSKDDSLDPRPVLVSGQFVKFDIKNKVFNSQDLANSTFGGILSAPGNKVSTYKVYVRLFDGLRPSTDFKLLKEVTVFPTDLYFTVNDIATALQVPVTEISLGDFIGFYGESFDSNGNRSDFSNLSAVIAANSGAYKQAYRFNCSVQDTTPYGPADYDAINNWIGQ